MKNFIWLLFVMLGFLACKNEPKSNTTPITPSPEVIEEPQSNISDSVEISLDSTEIVQVETPKPQLNDSIKSRLDSIVMKLGGTFECRFTAVIGNDSAQSYYSGYDGRQHKKITEFDTPVEIGSCTKMFTASSILQLIEQQKLSLDDQLTTILPNEALYKNLLVISGKDYIDSVKVVNLLNHSSGLPDYLNEDDAKEIELHGDPSLKFTPNQLVALAKENELDPFVPGSSYRYANTNYILLGLIIEKLSGQTYQEYIQEHILDPLDLKHTYFGSTNPPANVATGHFKGKVASMPPTLAASAGEIISNLHDMQKFIRAWFKGELFNSADFMEKVKNENFLQMEDIIDMQYGMGVIRLLSRSMGHAGQTFGFQSYMASFPNQYSFAVAIDDASVDAWMAAVLLSNYLGDAPTMDEPLETEALQ